MPKKYTAVLTGEQRRTLTAVTRSGTHPARAVTRARVLLEADDGTWRRSRRNRTPAGAGCDWRFTTADARAKRKRLDPIVE